MMYNLILISIFLGFCWNGIANWGERNIHINMYMVLFKTNVHSLVTCCRNKIKHFTCKMYRTDRYYHYTMSEHYERMRIIDVLYICYCIIIKLTMLNSSYSILRVSMVCLIVAHQLICVHVYIVNVLSEFNFNYFIKCVCMLSSCSSSSNHDNHI